MTIKEIISKIKKLCSKEEVPIGKYTTQKKYVGDPKEAVFILNELLSNFEHTIKFLYGTVHNVDPEKPASFGKYLGKIEQTILILKKIEQLEDDYKKSQEGK